MKVYRNESMVLRPALCALTLAAVLWLLGRVSVDPVALLVSDRDRVLEVPDPFSDPVLRGVGPLPYPVTLPRYP